MIYMGTPSSQEIRDAMTAGELGCMTSPAQGNIVPAGAAWAAENGRFGQGWPGPDRWFGWLGRTVSRYGAERCRFAVAPDIPFDSAGTLAESRPWLPRIRELGIPAAFAAQDGCDAGLVPWGEFDALFLAGSTEWKIGPVAERLSRQAKEAGCWLHMGRVNSYARLRIAEWFGCDSADGTHLAYGPDVNFARLGRWMRDLTMMPSLMSE